MSISRDIHGIAQDIVPELRRRLDEYLGSKMVLGSREYQALADELWDNKISILRVLEAALSLHDGRAHVEKTLRNAALFLEIGAGYAPNDIVDAQIGAERLKTRGLRTVMREVSKECEHYAALIAEKPSPERE